MTHSPTPPIPKALIEWLSELFPDRCPAPSLSEREVWMAAGAANVVRKLIHEHNSQTQLSLETRIKR